MFEVKRERHFRDYGRLKRAPTPTDTHPPAQQTETPEKASHEANSSEQPEKAPEKEHHHPQNHHSHHHHDESADVLEEADEDMVIY